MARLVNWEECISHNLHCFGGPVNLLRVLLLIGADCKRGSPYGVLQHLNVDLEIRIPSQESKCGGHFKICPKMHGFTCVHLGLRYYLKVGSTISYPICSSRAEQRGQTCARPSHFEYDGYRYVPRSLTSGIICMRRSNSEPQNLSIFSC